MSKHKFEIAVKNIEKRIAPEILNRKSSDKTGSTKPFNQNFREVMAGIDQRRSALRPNLDTTPS